MTEYLSVITNICITCSWNLPKGKIPQLINKPHLSFTFFFPTRKFSIRFKLHWCSCNLKSIIAAFLVCQSLDTEQQGFSQEQGRKVLSTGKASLCPLFFFFLIKMWRRVNIWSLSFSLPLAFFFFFFLLTSMWSTYVTWQTVFVYLPHQNKSLLTLYQWDTGV